MTLAQLLQVLHILEPLVDDVHEWLDGDQKEPPTALRVLPTEMKSEIELRLLKARAERRG